MSVTFWMYEWMNVFLNVISMYLKSENSFYNLAIV